MIMPGTACQKQSMKAVRRTMSMTPAGVSHMSLLRLIRTEKRPPVISEETSCSPWKETAGYGIIFMTVMETQDF